jgi:hypothetical protein
MAMRKVNGESWKGPSDAIFTTPGTEDLLRQLNASDEHVIQLSPGDGFRFLEGLAAYNHIAVHKNRVSDPTLCCVLLRKGKLITAVELEGRGDLEKLKGVLDVLF